MKVVVKVFNEIGKYSLQEITGLNENTIVEGKINSNKLFEFKWNNEDAVLHIGVNCYVVKQRRKLPKGWTLSINYIVKYCNKEIGCGCTRAKAIQDALTNTNYRSSKWKILCTITGYNKEYDYFNFPYVEELTKTDALNVFWKRFDNEHWI